MKKIIVRDILLSYPNFSKRLIIHNDSSKIQLGVIISQNGKPIAFYSCRLTPAQINYTTIEIKLLIIVETLKCFCTIILEHRITVYTDHKNLTFDKFTTERVLRWCLVLEEYIPELNLSKDLIMKQHMP